MNVGQPPIPDHILGLTPPNNSNTQFLENHLWLKRNVTRFSGSQGFLTTPISKYIGRSYRVYTFHACPVDAERVSPYVSWTTYLHILMTCTDMSLTSTPPKALLVVSGFWENTTKIKVLPREKETVEVRWSNLQIRKPRHTEVKCFSWRPRSWLVAQLG